MYVPTDLRYVCVPTEVVQSCEEIAGIIYGGGEENLV